MALHIRPLVENLQQPVLDLSRLPGALSGAPQPGRELFHQHMLVL